MHLKNLMIVYCLAFLFCSSIKGYAGTWRDDFEDGNLDGWEDKGLRVHWEAKDGTLQIDFRGRIPGLPLNETEGLSLVTIPPDQEEFSVSCEYLQVSASAFTEQDIGLLIGGISSKSRFGEEEVIFPWGKEKKRDRYPWMYYAFFTKSIKFTAFNFDKTILSRIQEDVTEHPSIRQMTIRLKNGLFQLLSAGQLVHEFTDKDFQRVNQVGFLANAYDMYARIDNFVISGPKIPDRDGGVAVKPSGMLATTWGAMKR